MTEVPHDLICYLHQAQSISTRTTPLLLNLLMRFYIYEHECNACLPVIPAFQLRAMCRQAPGGLLGITILELARVSQALLPLPPSLPLLLIPQNRSQAALADFALKLPCTGFWGQSW